MRSLTKGIALQAERAFRLAIEADPTSAEAYNNLGVTLVKQQKFDLAIVFLRQSQQKRS